MSKNYCDDFELSKLKEDESKPKNMKNIYIEKLSKYFRLSR